MKVILISAKARHGKDSTADIIKEQLENNGKRVLVAHYGDLVKYVCKTFFGWNGEKDEIGRGILQRVGTDEVRAAHPNFWVKFIFDILSVFNQDWDYVLIPDTRFPNEIEYFRHSESFDVCTIRVKRLNYISPLTEEQQQHASETALDNYNFDYIIESESGLEKLKAEVDKVLLDIEKYWGQ